MLKNGFDIVLATFLLIVLSPLLLIVAVAIKLDSSGPILFIQDRMGKDGTPFRLIKFRTMSCSAADGSLLTQGKIDHRITKVGGVIRRIHLDEIMQLINVLKGDMSI